jgi:hypothetical protein
MASTRLSKTFSGNGDRQKFTFSAWIKRTTNSQSFLWTAGSYSSSSMTQWLFDNDGTLGLYDYNSSGSVLSNVVTTRKFKDTSAWYHFVIRVDTTQSTAADRIRIYVNGVQETSFSATNYPGQNDNYIYSESITAQYIGQRADQGNTSSFEGLMTHIHWTDGYSYDASSFGETDSTSGIWKPKTAPSVTYGTNGYFLKMENSAAMGTDSSGNSNTFTVTGTLTQIIDTPSNNFATLNVAPSVEIGSSAFYEYGGTNVRSSTSNWVAGVSGIYLNQGKWYFEMQPGATTDAEFGIAGESKIQNGGTSGGVNGRLFYYEDNKGYAYAYSAANGQIYFSTPSDGTQTASYGNSFGTSDFVGCFADLDNNKLYFSKNGTIQNSGTGYTIQSGIYYAFGANSYNANTSLNFGNGTFKGVKLTGTTYADANGEGIFKYSPNQGGASNFDSAAKNFYAINTKNIKEFG